MPVMTASLIPPLPKLLRAPEPAPRPFSKASLATPDANSSEESGTETATVLAAPAYDEEHPDELSYRPFPIAPLLTATASVDDSALAVLTHPDVGKVLELMELPDGQAPMRLQPGAYDAQKALAALPLGAPVDLSAAANGPAGGKGMPPEGQKVASQPQ
jgi:hypothetical protein